MESLILQIEGMSCNHCLNAVNKALSAHPGVKIESVKIGQAVVEFDPGATSAGAICAAIDEAGFPASPSSNPR